VTGKFFNKKYVQKWSRFFISNFPKKCMSVYTVQANKGDEVTHFIIQIRYTANIVPMGCFPVTHFSHVRRKSLNLLKFHISANNLNKCTLNHTQN
jgi:hypothetical protein